MYESVLRESMVSPSDGRKGDEDASALAGKAYSGPHTMPQLWHVAPSIGIPHSQVSIVSFNFTTHCSH